MRQTNKPASPLLTILCCLLLITVTIPVTQITASAQPESTETPQHYFQDNFDDNAFDSNVWEKVR